MDNKQQEKVVDLIWSIGWWALSYVLMLWWL